MRKIQCPYCTGEVLSEENGRAHSSVSMFPRVQNWLSSINSMFDAVKLGNKTVSRKKAIGGECKACDNKGYIDDPSDTSKADQAVADFFDKNKDKITELEGRRGASPGGSRVTRVAFDDILIVGHTLNKEQSYTTKENVPGPGGRVVTKDGRAAVDAGTKEHTQVTGKSVPSNGGGQYVIQCGNKYTLIAGAQGISIKTKGPIEIDGGIVSFTGADMTFGSRVGQTSIAGNHTVIEGKNVSINATGQNGQVGINGSLDVPGNLRSGGMYVDNLYCARATMPSKNATSKAGTGTRFVGGPPSWGGVNRAAIKNSITDLKKLALERTTDVNLMIAAGPGTPRFALNLKDAMTNVTYSSLPFEPKPTGFCYVNGNKVDIYNYPHLHIEQDNVHTHSYETAAIHTGYETSAGVRDAFANAGGNTNVAATGTNLDAMQTIANLASTAAATANATGAQLTIQGNAAAFS